MIEIMEKLYPFVYRGLLTEESLDKAGRRTRITFDLEEVETIKGVLSYEMLDDDLLTGARRMALVYTPIHAFENMVREFARDSLVEKFGETWWTKVPDRIQTKVDQRIEEEAKFRWHGTRGGNKIEYCDFGDLSSIMGSNWEVFKDTLADLEWAKSILSILERSRNIIMHGGQLARPDIERIGNNIRDWVRQVG